MTNLAWGATAFAAGYQRTNTTGQVNDLIKWGADFLVAAWNSSAQGFVAVMGNNSQDFNYYGPVEEYETYVERPAFYINAQAPGKAPLCVLDWSTRFRRAALCNAPIKTAASVIDVIFKTGVPGVCP